MKKDKKKTSIGPFSLPNHCWLPADWMARIDLEWKKAPGRIIRDCGRTVLVRKEALKWGPRRGEALPPGGKLDRDAQPFDLWLNGSFAVSRLAERAEEGDTDAALELARIATQATAALTNIARTKPGLLLRLSRLRHGWPVIKMKREALSAEEKGLFAGIQLGAEALIELDPQTAKWVRDDAAKFAYLLLRYVDRVRRSQPKSAKQLPEFNDGTAPRWWKVAKAVLLHSYPEPEIVDEFKALVTAPRKRRSPGRMKSAILEKLQSRFLSFARNDCFPDLSRVT